MSINPVADFVTQAEERILAPILADSFFSNVPAMKNADGDIVQKIEEAILSLGLFMIVKVGEGPVPVPGDTENWNLIILITENPLLNRGEGPTATGKTARFALQNLIRVFANSTAGHLETATELASADGAVVWQIKGKAMVALPVAT